MKLRYLGQQREADGAATFYFAPLEPVEWVAGQSIRLEVPGFYGPEERRFTISAAPAEKNLAITTRVSKSSFKQSLAALEPDVVVHAYDIRGEFTWPQRQHPLLIASGIGITPFRAMLAQRRFEKRPLAATLLHATRGDEGIFHPTFREWQQEAPEFQFQHVAGRRLSAEEVYAHIQAFEQRPVYISGPQAMVQALRQELQGKYGVEASRIVTDLFTGNLAADA